jgi:hypothetical protein
MSRWISGILGIYSASGGNIGHLFGFGRESGIEAGFRWLAGIQA